MNKRKGIITHPMPEMFELIPNQKHIPVQGYQFLTYFMIYQTFNSGLRWYHVIKEKSFQQRNL